MNRIVRFFAAGTLLFCPLFPLNIHANMAAPAPSDTAPSIAFEPNDSIAVLPERLEFGYQEAVHRLLLATRCRIRPRRKFFCRLCFLRPNWKRTAYR